VQPADGGQPLDLPCGISIGKDSFIGRLLCTNQSSFYCLEGALQLLMNRYGYIRFAHGPERVLTKGFVVLIIGNSKSNHLGAQGYPKPYTQLVNPRPTCGICRSAQQRQERGPLGGLDQVGEEVDGEQRAIGAEGSDERL